MTIVRDLKAPQILRRRQQTQFTWTVLHVCCSKPEGLITAMTTANRRAWHHSDSANNDTPVRLEVTVFPHDEHIYLWFDGCCLLRTSHTLNKNYTFQVKIRGFHGELNQQLWNPQTSWRVKQQRNLEGHKEAASFSQIWITSPKKNQTLSIVQDNCCRSH